MFRCLHETEAISWHESNGQVRATLESSIARCGHWSGVNYTLRISVVPRVIYKANLPHTSPLSAPSVLTNLLYIILKYKCERVLFISL